MPPTKAKSQGVIDAFPFNEAMPLDFPAVTLSGTTQNNTVVAARMWLPQAVKIVRVVAGMSGSLAGTISLNIVRGTAAEVPNSGGTLYASMPIPDTDYGNQPIAPATQAYPPAYPTAGQKLFLSDQALTVQEDPATILTPSDSALTGAFAPGTPGFEYDAIWGPGGAEVTLRLPCSSFTGVVQVRVYCKSYDPNYSKPVLATFNPAVDIP